MQNSTRSTGHDRSDAVPDLIVRRRSRCRYSGRSRAPTIPMSLRRPRVCWVAPCRWLGRPLRPGEIEQFQELWEQAQDQLHRWRGQQQELMIRFFLID